MAFWNLYITGFDLLNIFESYLFVNDSNYPTMERWFNVKGVGFPSFEIRHIVSGIGNSRNNIVIGLEYLNIVRTTDSGITNRTSVLTHDGNAEKSHKKSQA